jgi:hypothetical protein
VSIVASTESLPQVAQHAGDSTLRLHGRRLVWVHLAWWLTCALSLSLLVVSILLRSSRLQQVCKTATDCLPRLLTLTDVQALEHAGLTLRGYIVFELALNTFVVLVFFAVAVILYSRKPDDWMALYVSFTFLIFPLGTLNIVDYIADSFAAFATPAWLLDSLGGAMIGILCYLFPDGRFVPRWTRFLVPLIIARELANRFLPWPGLAVALFAAALLTFVYAQVYRYRHTSSPEQRQQTKWFVYGVVVAVGGLVALLAFYSFVLTTQAPVNFIADAANAAAVRVLFLAIPISLMVAVLRRRLWDIDHIVNRTLVYIPLTAVLAGLLAVCSTLAQKLFVAATGATNDWGPILGTLIVVACFEPFRRELQNFVDRHFQSTHDPATELAAFRAQLDARLSAVDAAQAVRRLAQAAAAAFAAVSAEACLQRPGFADYVYTVGQWHGDTQLAAELVAGDAHLGTIKLSARRNGALYAPSHRAALEAAAQAIAQAIVDDMPGTPPPDRLV